MPDSLRALAFASITGRSFLAMAATSESVKSFRHAFSANSPSMTCSKSTTRTGIVFQPNFLQAVRRRRPAISFRSGVMTMGCKRPGPSRMLSAKVSMSPRSRRNRLPTLIEEIGSSVIGVMGFSPGASAESSFVTSNRQHF